MLHHTGQVMDQDPPQPGQPLLLGLAPELAEVAVSLEKRLLDQVGGIDAALQVQVDLSAGQQAKVVAIELQQFAQPLRLAQPRVGHQSLGVRSFAALHQGSSLSKPLGRFPGGIVTRIVGIC